MIQPKPSLKTSPIVTVTIAALAILLLGALSSPVLAQSAGEGPEIEADAAISDQPIFIMPRSGPFSPETIAIPNARIIAAWGRSGHSDFTSEAFTHWNEDGAIEPECSFCHSGIGFRTYHGLDGTVPGIPETPVALGGVVDCDTCHAPQLSTITEITLSSGIIHPVSGSDAACVTCHQGRASGARIAAVISAKAEDDPHADLRFVNPHYALAAGTNLGAYGKLGYEYPGKTYSGRFNHAKPVETCVSCHDPHTLEVAEATCLTCHDSGDPEKIRIQRFSFDGSGNTAKGIHDDIHANSAILLTMIGEYADQVIGTGIVYDEAHYPYFYLDANSDGVPDREGEKALAYNAWTPRLLRTVYNWKFVTSDGGVHVHNPPYALELVYDSIEDLTQALERDMAELGLLR